MLNYSTRSGQVAILSSVIFDPNGSVPEVKHALDQIVNRENLKNRPVIVEDRLFSSITAAAHWLHYMSPKFWVKAEEEKVHDLPRILGNIRSLIRSRCDALDYHWSDGEEGRKGYVIPEENWSWMCDEYLHYGLDAYGFIDMREYQPR